MVSVASIWPAASAARRSADAIGSAILGEGCQGNLDVAVAVAVDGVPEDVAGFDSSAGSGEAGSKSGSRMPSASSTSNCCVDAVIAGITGAAEGLAAGIAGMLGRAEAAGVNGRAAGVLGTFPRGGAAGACFGTFETCPVGATEAVGADAFVPSLPLRSKPRATRSVPFACSTLMGLVRTRFAPIRNAFATPACPSTTATASDDWFELELRALLNSSVAFCSLSQSTTTASKCCAMSFFTAANGSVQDSTVKSRSFKTCVTMRAVFSSGQKSNAW